MSRIVVPFLLLVSALPTFAACAVETPPPVDVTDDSDQRGRRAPSGGATSGDGSDACVAVDNGFGATNVTNHCGRPVVVAYCSDVVVGTPTGLMNDCLDAVTIGHRASLGDGQILGLTRGHTTGAPDAKPILATCFGPSVPSATNGDLRQGYRCL